ncbi:MAG: M4 family metallopeptidase [Acidobacteriota bacterium]|nr:M4 family metallopeptidase [Acidobacteriota bacterium]
MRQIPVRFLLMVLTVSSIFTGSILAAKDSDDRSKKAESKAREHLSKRGLDMEQLKARDIIVDETGSHVRFSQYVDGVRVYGSEVITHEKINGKFTAPTGKVSDVTSSDLAPPTFDGHVAVGVAKNIFGYDGRGEIELVLYPVENQLVLAYMVDIKNTDEETNDPRREMIVINARTGQIIDRWNNLQTSAASGTGYGFYAGQVTGLPIDYTGGTYYLFDVPNNGKTTDYNNRTCPITGCTKTGTVYSSTDSVFGTTGSLSDRQSIGVDAHFFAERTLSYFSTTFGRNGIDNNNNKNLKFGFMVSRTHYGNNYNNAFWDGASMTYGDGDGSTYRPFDAVDVVGHEMMHGITERTSDLVYQNESGAANESFSDIFGTVVEYYTGTRTGYNSVSYPADYWIGEDLYYSNDPSNPTRGIRNMADPHLEGDPCHYSERYTGTSDNGGVHINSGIMNKMWYLLTNGGTNHKDTTGTLVSGIGMTDSAAIAYDADTKYCTANDNFAKVADAWMNAARNRFGAGSAQAQQTYNAWKASGVTPTQLP